MADILAGLVALVINPIPGKNAEVKTDYCISQGNHIANFFMTGNEELPFQLND